MEDIDPALSMEKSALAHQRSMIEAIEKGDSNIQQFYQNSVIFITGGSGFLGKLLIEKLFRACKIRKVYLLLRSKKGKTYQERLKEVLNDQIYEGLYKKQPDFEQKIVPIEGDVTALRLGITDEDWKSITDDVNVIFHVAATINFVEPLQQALLCNLRAIREVLTLGKACKSLRSLVHVSTAYAHATFLRCSTEVIEQFYDSPVPPVAMLELAEACDPERLNKITPGLLSEWPNTYAFTKALGEEAVRTMAGDLPVCIVRPAIVINTYREPMPGWIDMSSVLGPSGLTLGTILGVVHVLISDHNIKVDFVPADYVNNAIIAAAWETAMRRGIGEKETKIYTVSSARNFIKWGHLNSFLNNESRGIISPKTVWYGFAIETKNKWLYSLLTLFLHFIPAFFADLILKLLGKKIRLMKIYNTVYKMSNVLAYFMTHEWFFDDRNTQKLFDRMSVADKTIFNFDINCVVWKEQILLWCIGLRKYVIKDGLQGTRYGMKKQRWLRILHYIVMVFYVYVAWKLLGFLFSVFQWVF